MKAILILLTGMVFLFSDKHPEKIQIEFKISDILGKKNSSLEVKKSSGLSSQVIIRNSEIAFSDALLRKEGTKWILNKQGKDIYFTDSSFRKVMKMSGETILFSKGISKHSRKWFDARSNQLIGTSKLTNSSKGYKKCEFNFSEANDLAEIILIERVIYARNVFISNTSAVSF